MNIIFIFQQTFENVLKASTMAKDQIYLEFIAMPTKNDTTKEYIPTCCLTFKKVPIQINLINYFDF